MYQTLKDLQVVTTADVESHLEVTKEYASVFFDRLVQ